NIGPIQLAGSVGLDLNGLAPALESYDVSVAAKHPDLAALASAFGWDAGLAAGLGGVDLTARLHGDLGRMQVEGLNGRLGPVELSGRLSADFAGERPSFVAVLETGEVPLALVLGREIDPASLGDFDARLDLAAAALTHDSLRVHDVGLNASLTAGRLDLARFAGTLHGGALQLAGKAELGEVIAAELAITAIEVDLGTLLRAQAGIAGIAGPVYFKGDFTARGGSAAELAAGLAGDAEISGLLTFEGDAGPDAVSEQGALEDISDLGAFLARTLGPDSVRLAGTFTAEAGQLQTENTRLDGQPAYALTLAKLDLPGWSLDGVTDIYERSAGRPLISSIAYGGPLDALEVESLELPESPAPEPEEAPTEPQAEEPPAPAVEEEPVPIVREPAAPEAEEQAAPEAEEAPDPAAEEAPAPLVSETVEPAPALPDIGAEAEALPAPAETIEPAQPKPAPQPASPAAPQPAEDDLLKDLLKLGG
ncbi:MAG: AsmA family protein, partial [Kiloniellales bacterium]|nr:AsmA family protein [Kiloniellales bacterium]